VLTERLGMAVLSDLRVQVCIVGLAFLLVDHAEGKDADSFTNAVWTSPGGPKKLRHKNAVYNVFGWIVDAKAIAAERYVSNGGQV